MKKFILFFVLTVLLVGAAFFLVKQQKSQENEEKKTPKQVIVIEVKPEVSVKQAGADAFLPIDDSAVVAQGAEIKTSASGKARLVYPDGTVTILDGNTVIALTTLENDGRRSRIELVFGSIVSKVKNILGTGEYYQVQTENVVASVRGTVFATEHRNKISKVYGIQNRVNVQARDPEKRDVIKGTETEISGGEKTEVSTAALPAENRRLTKEKLTAEDYQKPLLRSDVIDELDEEYLDEKDVQEFLEELQRYNLNDSELQEQLKRTQDLIDELEDLTPPIPVSTPTIAPKPSVKPTPSPKPSPTPTPSSKPSQTPSPTPSPTPMPKPSITSVTPAAVSAGTDFFINGAYFTTGRNISQIRTVTIGALSVHFGIIDSMTLVAAAPETPGIYDINVFTTTGERLTLTKALTVQ